MICPRRNNFTPSPLLCLAVMACLLFCHPGSTAAAPPPGNDLESTYVLSPDDQLDIAVTGHDDLKASVTILPDGTFNYPYAGKVRAANLTVDELTRLLTEKLDKQINDPNITVTVRESRPRKVSVLGAVKAPGLYDWKPGWHLLQALAACGGPAQAAELTQATLMTDGGAKSRAIDIVALMNGVDSENLPLASGDVLLVQQRDPSVAQVQVSGEVTKPGSYTVPSDGASVVAVLTEAGGPTARGALTRAQIMHKGQITNVNLRPLMSQVGDAAGATRLVAGDVLLIPANTSQVAVMGEVRAPNLYSVPDGDGLPLITALAEAGGTTNEGDKKNIYVVRRGVDGKRVATVVNAEEMLKGSAGSYLLQPEDILYVPSRKHGTSTADVLGLLTPIGLISSLLKL